MDRRPATEAYREAGIRPERSTKRDFVLGFIAMAVVLAVFLLIRLLTSWSSGATDFTAQVMSEPSATVSESGSPAEPTSGTRLYPLASVDESSDDATTDEASSEELAEATTTQTVEATEESTEAATTSESTPSPTEAKPDPKPTAVTAPPPVGETVTIGSVQLTMPPGYSRADQGDYIGFVGPSGTVRLHSGALRKQGDTKTLTNGDTCLNDASAKPTPIPQAEAEQLTAIGHIRYGRSFFYCPGQTYTYGWWFVDGVFAADVLYVGEHLPFDDLNTAFLAAQSVN